MTIRNCIFVLTNFCISWSAFADTPSISHGPMLGAVSEHAVRIWARTTVPADVTCILSQVGAKSAQLTKKVRTTLASDNTCIITFENNISGVIGISGDVHRSDIYKLPMGKDRHFYDFTSGSLSRLHRTPPNPLPQAMIHSYGKTGDNNMYGEIEFRPASDKNVAIIFRSLSAKNGLVYEHKLTPDDLALEE